MAHENKFLSQIAPGHELMSYQNGRVTQEIVDGIHSAGLESVEVAKDQRIIYAIHSNNAPTPYGIELTGILRSTGRQNRVILIPTDSDPAEVRAQLTPHLGSQLVDITYHVVDPAEVLKDPSLLKDRAMRLVQAKMPRMSIPSEE